jgi:hypothetical protein
MRLQAHEYLFISSRNAACIHALFVSCFPRRRLTIPRRRATGCERSDHQIQFRKLPSLPRTQNRVNRRSRFRIQPAEDHPPLVEPCRQSAPRCRRVSRLAGKIHRNLPGSVAPAMKHAAADRLQRNTVERSSILVHRDRSARKLVLARQTPQRLGTRSIGQPEQHLAAPPVDRRRNPGCPHRAVPRHAGAADPE